MPLRLAQLPNPNKESLGLYRRLSFGGLADFHVLDTRQYRTDQPCGDGNKPRCAAAADPAATMLGADQERWLLEGLAGSGGRWNVLAQQVMMAQVDRTPGDGETYSMDQWAGYVDQRNRLLRFFGERRPSNPVVITGDIHSNWVADLLLDPDDPGSAVVATELVGTSVSSGGDGSDQPTGVRTYLPQNPAVRFHNGQRGYVLNTLTAGTWRADYRVVPVVSRPGGTVTTRAAFVVESGRPGAQPA
jgi:alkaline phosphatase D